MRLPPRFASLIHAFGLALMLGFALPATAAAPAIYTHSARLSADAAYTLLYATLEKNGFYVIFEPDMGRSLAGMKDTLGADYNRNQLSTMKSLVFCKPRATNEIANADPALLALCPLHITLTHKDGVSTVYFARPSAIAAGSPGEALAKKLEADIVKVIESAFDGK
ncbi:DUF302 domain-containing protein [Thiobacillus sp.]|uniref:DUF302 domain-containing protein n=1 Tax=Thiobacillus sp. TaxID=924 RepID=UPI00286E6871|nr:DUF302 domain-containing protein [Thiobacillus sp.]